MVRVATGLCQENEHLIVTVTVIPEYIHSKLVGCFSDVLWHTHGARSLIVSGRSITACFILLFLIKPAAKKRKKKRITSSKTIPFTHPPMPSVPSRWCFLHPLAARPSAVPNMTCDSSSTWPPSTPTLHPNPLQSCFLPHPSNVWEIPPNMPRLTCHTPSPTQITICEANSAHNHTFNMNRGISLQLKSHSDTQM